MIGIRDIRRYIRNRWINKTHCLTSNLERGQWHEFDEKMLHCLFDELVRFVEDEAGMKLVQFWANDISPDGPYSWQIAGKEMLELYHWWRDERPKRMDPFETEDWDKVVDQDLWVPEGNHHRFVSTPELDRASEATRILEKMYEKEDTEMLVRLVKIRWALWT